MKISWKVNLRFKKKILRSKNGPEIAKLFPWFLTAWFEFLDLQNLLKIEGLIFETLDSNFCGLLNEFFHMNNNVLKKNLILKSYFEVLYKKIMIVIVIINSIIKFYWFFDHLPSIQLRKPFRNLPTGWTRRWGSWNSNGVFILTGIDCFEWSVIVLYRVFF